jgi:hypothetical protein
MTRDEKMELIQRMLGLRHKVKVLDSMKPAETHEELSSGMLSRWELEDEIKAIEIILEGERAENVKAKLAQVEEQFLSGKPIVKKKK